MNKPLHHLLLCGLILLGMQLPASAANYFWRATAVNNLFTNLGNWETAPGGGVSPPTAPSATDDVFFLVTSTQSSIDFNSGNCRNFTFAAPTAFTFDGTLTALTGNITCNGNATLGTSAATTINFDGTGARTIDMGTTANKVFATLNFPATNTGSYTLSSTFNSNAFFNINGPGFSTGGFPFTYAGFAVNGDNTRTINFSNSRVTCNRNGTTGGYANTYFGSSPSSTTYNLSGTRLVLNNDLTGTVLSLTNGVTISPDSIIINAGGDYDQTQIDLASNDPGAPAVINANVVKVDAAFLMMGNMGFGQSNANNLYGTLNVGKLVFSRANMLYNMNSGTTLNIGAGGIVEPAGCQRLVILSPFAAMNLNATPALTTSRTDYYGVNFGGAGFTAATSSNVGFNTGTVSWGAAVAGINFWWVGGDGNWNDPTEWSIIGSGGAPQSALGCLPGFQDNVFFDANSFTGSQTVTIPVNYDAICKNIDWSAGSNQGVLFGDGRGLAINGNANFTKARGINVSLWYIGSGSQTITSGTFFTYGGAFINIQGTGSYTLTDPLTAASYFTQRAGTFNTAGFTLTVNTFGSASVPAIATNIRAINFGTSQIEITAGGVNIDLQYLSTLNTANSPINFTGGSNPNFVIDRTGSGTPFVSAVVMNNINFNVPGTASLSANGIGGYSVSYNNVTFLNDGYVGNYGNATSHTVNSYTFNSGHTYTFDAGKTFNITTGINTVASPCQDMLFLKSGSAGIQTNLNKASGTLSVSSAVVSDINATGVPLSITAGLDNGNNTNVTVGAVSNRTLYWVGNTGNWSDGAHWSIGISGGNPAVTNVNGCTPRLIDSVVFDNNSFSLTGETVTMDVNAYCKGMMWTTGAGAQAPNLTGNGTLNNYGCLEFTPGINTSWTGPINMMGNNTAPNSNYIDPNGLSLNNQGINLLGGGTYDIRDSIKIYYGSGRFTLGKGNLYTHGNAITAELMSLNIGTGFTADVSGSTFISTYTYVFNSLEVNHAFGSIWNGTGMNLYANSNLYIVNSTGSPLDYGNIFMTSAVTGQNNITTASSDVTTFKNIRFTNTAGNFTSVLNGIMVMDTLEYAPFTTNLLVPGGNNSYTVNDTLIGYGTPCSPAYLRSYYLGTPAELKSVKCNLDLNFVNIRDINVTTCTAAQNKYKGADEGGNTNWTGTTVAGLTNLGADTNIICKYAPFSQPTTGFGVIPGITYLWSGGETTNTLPISTNGTYSVAVTYAPGCTLNDTRTITFVQAPPAVVPATYEQVAPGYCTYSGYNYYDGALASATFDKSIMAINPNGNVISPTTVKVNNQGTLTGTGAGTFTNSGTGYYQTTDGINSTRLTKRLHTVVAPGSYTTNGGVKVRVYYTAADTATMLTDAWPGAGTTSFKGWFKSNKHAAQGVLNDMAPGALVDAGPVTPIAYGTEGGVMYAEFLTSSFSTFGFMATTNSTPLPIRLLSFEATKQGSSAWLSWNTVQEEHTSYFGVEHSTDGNNWKQLGEVSAKGDNSSYGYTHSYPEAGLHFYRLRIADQDGSLAYSPVRTLDFNTAADNSNYQVYPNPSSHTVYIKGLTGKEQVKVYDVLGRALLQVHVTGMEAQANLAALPNATYNIVITGGTEGTRSFKIVKQD